jgi:N-acetylglucosaminyldiphosphoundecaprenol N-acetyl-beta-D-mannosaminyltransferase
MDQVLTTIDTWANTKKAKPKFIVTAYSEFLVEADKDKELRKAILQADQIVPDGISVAGAVDFIKQPGAIQALRVVGNGLLGGYANRVIGVRLTQALIEGQQYKLFLLGGQTNSGAVNILARRYDYAFDPVHPETNELTTKQKEILISKINNSKSDILLCGLKHFDSEKWVAKNLAKLKVKIVICVGSSFDELARVGQWVKPVPAWIEALGFKWLWRLYQNPKHISRIFKMLQFPIKLWLSKV